MRKKKKPQRGDGTAACPLSFRHSSGVLMGGCFHTGVALPLTPACILSHLQRSIKENDLYPARSAGLTSYALCFPLRTANFVFSALFRLELTYNLLDAYHSPFCLYAKVKKGRYRPANRGQRAVRKTKCYGLFRLRYDSGLSLFQSFAYATK